MGVFAENAPAYAAKGFRVFPTGGGDGKRPHLKRWPQVTSAAVPKLARKFPDANLGVIDGERVTRVDVDAPELIDGAIRRFGNTPVKVATPRGGFHLWYRANGERRRQRIDGQKIDVLGKGGYGIAPPSVCPGKGAYRFIDGGLDDIDRLPVIMPGALPSGAYASGDGRVPEGIRNKTLFRKCLRDLADGCDPDLVPARAMAWNESICNPPDSEAEVLKTAASAIKYHLGGRNWFCGRGVVKFTRAEFEVFGGDGDALMLNALFHLEHGSRAEPFAISPLAMAKADVIPGWTKWRYRNARDALLRMGLIVCVYEGTGRGNLSLYRLADKVSGN